MNCPVCATTPLAVTDRLGIEIDYCPKCRGVWLDRGELDKIVERSLQETPYAGAHGIPGRQTDASWGRGDHAHDHDRDHGDHGHDDHDRDDHAGRYPGRRRRSLLRELFDF